jgi:hypothetical protein
MSYELGDDTTHSLSASSLSETTHNSKLITYNSKTVGIVESEKTALIASACMPSLLWLATAGKGGLNPHKCRVLKNRKVVLFPDLGAYESWKAQARKLTMADVQVSDLLEQVATPRDREHGFDLADYLLRRMPGREQELKSGISLRSEKRESEKAEPHIIYSPSFADETLEFPFLFGPGADFEQTEQERQIAELEAFFAGATLPPVPFRLNAWTTINDFEKCVQSHLTALKASQNPRRFSITHAHLTDIRAVCKLLPEP